MHLWSLLTFDSWKLSNKKNLIFFPISNQLTLCQLLYSIEHSTDFRVFFHLFLPLSVCYLSGLYNVILFQFFISIDFTSCEWMMMANDFVPSTFLSHSIIVIVLTYFTLYHCRMCICISLHEQNFKLFYSLFLCFVIWFRCSRNKQEKKRMCVIFPTSLKYMKIEGWFVIASWACGWLYLQNFGYYPVFRFWFYFGFVNCWTIEGEKKRELNSWIEFYQKSMLSQNVSKIEKVNKVEFRNSIWTK